MTPLVLLPGMMCDARLFGPQLGPLSAVRAVHVAPIGGHPTMDALADDVLAHAPPRFALPALVLCGQQDTLCPPARHAMMADLIPHARLEVIEGAGHLTPLEAPAAVTTALMRFLEDT